MLFSKFTGLYIEPSACKVFLSVSHSKCVYNAGLVLGLPVKVMENCNNMYCMY